MLLGGTFKYISVVCLYQPLGCRFSVLRREMLSRGNLKMKEEILTLCQHMLLASRFVSHFHRGWVLLAILSPFCSFNTEFSSPSTCSNSANAVLNDNLDSDVLYQQWWVPQIMLRLQAKCHPLLLSFCSRLSQTASDFVLMSQEKVFWGLVCMQNTQYLEAEVYLPINLIL